MAFKKSTKIFIITGMLIFCLILAGCKVAPNTSTGASGPSLPQPKTLSDPTWIAIYKAIQKDVSGREDVIAFLIYNVSIDSVQFSSDGNLALVWTSFVDKTTGLVQSGEPGLVIAHKGADGTWTAVVQADATYASELQAIPDSMLSADLRSQYMPALQQAPKDGTVYTGYRLPWGYGQAKYLTGSIGHVLTYKSCPSTCLYAFDFADGTQFPIAAAKAGVVKYAVWSYENGNTTNANYLVIEDDTTTPTTYMVYFHLAQNSIDPKLRTPGAKVYQGQYLANADDTGLSTGNHLHFMVHANPDSYWGTSVDIVFDEVTVNGGRPRTCAEASSFPEYGTECMPNNLYTSRNGDHSLPTGGITLPEENEVLTAPTINVSGWMTDDAKVGSGQLMYKTNGDWTSIGAPVTDAKFTTQIDLCASNIPNGKFTLGLQVTDAAGNVSSPDTNAISVDKEYSCPTQPMVCTVGAGQAAIYSAANYAGTCQILEIGDYPTLADQPGLQNGQAASIQLGSGVSVLLYSQTDFGGTQEFFNNGDSDLSDNDIGSGTVSSVKVISFVAPPVAPTLTLPQNATTEDSVTLAWTVEDGTETSASLTGPNNYAQTLDWQSGTSWQVGLLAAGDYTFSVSARNLAGTTQITDQFTIAQPKPLPVVALTALPESLNSTAIPLAWTVTTGADYLDHFEIQVRTDGGDWTDWSTQLAADARSAVYTGELGHIYDFRIRGVTTTNKAPDYSETDFVTTTLLQVCQQDSYEGTTPGDDDISGAAPVELGVEQQHTWCPAGDVDWVAFSATKGQMLRFTTSPVGANTAAREQLFDTDGVTMLGQATPVDAASQASLDWTVPADGVYYVKYLPVDQQIAGSEAAYTAKIEVESSVQTTPLVCGSITIPAALGAAYLLTSKVIKKKKSAKRAGW